MIALLNWGLNHWYVFLWLGILGVFGAVGDFFLACAHAIGSIGDRRHQRRIEEIRAAHPEPPVLPTPGPCVHRQVVPVHNSVTGEREAWLCRNCREPLPADWAVEAADLPDPRSRHDDDD